MFYNRYSSLCALQWLLNRMLLDREIPTYRKCADEQWIRWVTEFLLAQFYDKKFKTKNITKCSRGV